MITTGPHTDEHEPIGLLDTHIAGFLRHLQTAGYTDRTRRKKRPVAKAFAHWMQRQRIALHELNDAHIAAFVRRAPRKRHARVKREQAVLSQLLTYLRQEVGGPGSRPPPEAPPIDDRLRQYVHYLRNTRGLAENSVHVYVPFIRDFLRDQGGTSGGVSVDAFDATTIRRFLLDHARDRSSEYGRLLATALRSFCRFLFVHGDLATDLSTSVPTVRRYRHATVPPFLTTADMDRVLAAIDRSTSTGRRDYAILVLLARLGLRAGETVTLELDDIRWRSGELVIRGKGRVVEHVPLLADVGEALARYLREDRRASASRRVFQRVLAPHGGFAGPAAVGHIVRRALAHAQIPRTGRGAAHLFRHGLATQMIRHGASLAEIGQVLRHRSQTTTAIYAHVAFDALRTVAGSWPVAGGEQ